MQRSLKTSARQLANAGAVTVSVDVSNTGSLQRAGVMFELTAATEFQTPRELADRVDVANSRRR
jgi:hypothetical protein